MKVTAEVDLYNCVGSTIKTAAGSFNLECVAQKHWLL